MTETTDYKKMYYCSFAANADAIEILKKTRDISAALHILMQSQQKCENIYLSDFGNTQKARIIQLHKFTELSAR